MAILHAVHTDSIDIINVQSILEGFLVTVFCVILLLCNVSTGVFNALSVRVPRCQKLQMTA